MARQATNQNPFRRPVSVIICVLSLFVALYIYVFFSYFHSAVANHPPSHHQDIRDQDASELKVDRVQQPQTKTIEKTSMSLKEKEVSSQRVSTPMRVSKSNQSEVFEDFDMVTAVVECQTSHGNLVIDVREKWAPLGAPRYLELVEQGLFTDLPFFRVCPRYITQFGVRYGWSSGLRSILDDPTLWGKRDMNFGYLFFAGSGTNSRNSQMVIAFCQTEACKVSTLGKTPWEVPIGTIRRTGFNTLIGIEKTGFPYPSLEMSGLAANAGGPNQALIRSNPNYLKESYPQMAYWSKCEIVQRDIRISRDLTRDHNLETASIPFDISRYTNNMIVSSALTAESAPVYVEFLIVLNGNNEDKGPSKNLAQRVVLEINPIWAPLGAKRFIELVETFYFDNAAFFRVIKGFMAQFGIAAVPSASSYWRSRSIKDDPVIQSNSRGTISFATSGPNSRTSQLFINFGNNKYLDKEGFTPIGRVVEGLETVIDQIYHRYGEGGRGDGSDGKGPSQGRANMEGKKYLDQVFPKLSYIKYATVLEDYVPQV